VKILLIAHTQCAAVAVTFSVKGLQDILARENTYSTHKYGAHSLTSSSHTQLIKYVSWSVSQIVVQAI